jgi:hypothetical protein
MGSGASTAAQILPTRPSTSTTSPQWTDEPANLVTACASCNGGKSAVPLDQRKLAPAATTEELAEHLEQMREFLSLQRALSQAKRDAVEMLAAEWEQRIGPMTQDMYDRLGGLMATWPTERLLEAMEITGGRKLGTVGRAFRRMEATDQTKYFHGILRRWKAGA